MHVITECALIQGSDRGSWEFPRAIGRFVAHSRGDGTPR